MDKEGYNFISGQLLDSCIQVHREMGPGLLEVVYERCLIDELSRRNIKAENQVPIPLVYKNKELDKVFRIDLLVEDEVVVEIKAVDNMIPLFKAQLLSYLKLTDKRLGILINFNVPVIKNGFYRYVNGF
ncbi:MAG: GxxExxY protein [Flavobacteriales bacterium]